VVAAVIKALDMGAINPASIELLARRAMDGEPVQASLIEVGDLARYARALPDLAGYDASWDGGERGGTGVRGPGGAWLGATGFGASLTTWAARPGAPQSTLGPGTVRQAVGQLFATFYRNFYRT
jgi:hypothetical protein